MFKLIPNFLTVSRIILSFIFVYFFWNGKFLDSLIVFSIAAISDFLDGYLARKFQISSRFGSMLDPIADKILMFAAYFTLAYVNIIPSYVAALVILRDIFIVLVVVICILKEIQITFSPLLSSKINTTVQLMFVIFVLTCKAFSIAVPLDIFIFVICCSTVYSGIDYAIKYSWIGNELLRK